MTARERPDAQPKRLLSVAEAARRLGISESSAYRLAAVGSLPGQVKLPGFRMRVRARVLEAWLDGHEAPDGSAAVPQEARPSPPQLQWRLRPR
jgi:excisionase family DNA binding protein